MCSFWSYTVKISEILEHLRVNIIIFFIFNGTTGFLDENWSSLVEKKKAKFDLYYLYF